MKYLIVLTDDQYGTEHYFLNVKDVNPAHPNAWTPELDEAFCFGTVLANRWCARLQKLYGKGAIKLRQVSA